MSDQPPNKKLKTETGVTTYNKKSPLRSGISSLLGDNFQVENYAIVSILTMIAVLFMFQTDIIAFRDAIQGLSNDQIVALTSALGGPINQAGIDVDTYTRAMYQQVSANMDIPVNNISDLVNELVQRNSAIQQLMEAGWTFPALYPGQSFPSIAALVGRIIGDTTSPISNLFNSILGSLRVSLGMPSMTEIVSIIQENSSNFIQNSPRLEPVRMYYYSLLNLVNGDGNLFRDLQSIATITAFNQYANIYSGVFVALMVALRNSVSLTSAMVGGIVRGTNGVLTFVIGEELYENILGEIGSTTRSIVQAPFTGSFHIARFVIFQMNRIVNSVLEIDSPFDIFGGDQSGATIPENIAIVNHQPVEIPMNLGSNVDDEYDLLREIGDFTELYILRENDFQAIIQQMVENTNYRNISDALQEVLVPEQHSYSQSQQSEMSSSSSNSRASNRSSVYYGDSNYRIAVFLQRMISCIFTTSVFFSNPLQSTDALLTELNEEMNNLPNQDQLRQNGIVVDELLDDPRATNEIIGNVTQVVHQETNALELLQQYGSRQSSPQNSPKYDYDAMDVEFGGSRKKRARLGKRRTKKMKKMNKKGKSKKIKRKSLKVKKRLGRKSKRRV